MKLLQVQFTSPITFASGITESRLSAAREGQPFFELELEPAVLKGHGERVRCRRAGAEADDYVPIAQVLRYREDTSGNA